MPFHEQYPDGPPHGTASRYTHGGCRCGDCRDANTAAGRRYRRKPGVMEALRAAKRLRAVADPERHVADLAARRAWKKRNKEHVKAYDREYRLRRKHGEPISRPESPFDRIMREAA